MNDRRLFLVACACILLSASGVRAQQVEPGESMVPSVKALSMMPDLKLLQQRLESAGYAFKRPINEMPQYRVAVAHIEDPDGNHLELIQRT